MHVSGTRARSWSLSSPVVFIKTEWFHDTDMNHETDNGDGMHVIHTGGKYASYLQVPVVPPKYKVGDYVWRG